MDRRFEKRITRYLAEREASCNSHIDRLDMSSWFSYWHTHPDMKCRANKARVLVASLTYKLLLRVEARCVQREEPIQVWATLCENTGNYGIFLHSPNPNGTPYPYEYEGVVWGSEVLEEAQGVVDSVHEIGKVKYGDETVYIIRKRA